VLLREGVDLGACGIRDRARFDQAHVGLVQGLDGRRIEAAALEAVLVDAVRAGVIAGGRDERGNVARNHGPQPGEAVIPDATELVHAGKAAEDDPFADVDVARKRGRIGEDRVIAHPAIMGDMGVGHEQVGATHVRDTATLGCAAVEGDVFADGIAVADLQPGGFAVVFEILRGLTDRREGKDAIGLADAGGPAQDDVRTDAGAGGNLDLRADDAERADLDVIGDPRLGIDERLRVNHDAVSRTAPMRSATQATSLPTRASAANFHMPRLARLSSTAISS